MSKIAYVVVVMNDKPHPKWGWDEKGPLIMETYLNQATLEEAQERIKRHGTSWGTCRIAKVELIDE